VLEFDGLCSATSCLLAFGAESAHWSISPPTIELKLHPNSLKYSFLGLGESLPVIIASNLDPDQEHKLITLLRENKEAISCTVGDIMGISPPIM